MIRAVERSEKQPYSHLTEALDSTNDLLDRRITSERYRQVADCMLSETYGTGKLSIFLGYLKGCTLMAGILAYLSLTSSTVLGLNPLVWCLMTIPLYFALQNLETECQVPKGVQPNALVDGMSSFLASFTSSEPVVLSEADDVRTAATAPVPLGMV